MRRMRMKRPGKITPVSIFAMSSGAATAVSVVKGFIDYTGLLDPLAKGHLGLLAIALALTGIQMLFIGLLADLIDQRMKL